MKYAIIAAGEGSRLTNEGIHEPKPLIKLCGEPMIERLLRIFHTLGAEETEIIVNNIRPETGNYVESLAHTGRYGKINLIRKTTPGSMHSLHHLAPLLQDAPFCLTTTDTIFDEQEFATYIHSFHPNHTDALMAVTNYIDDEKPLYIETDNRMHITAFLDTRPPKPHYVSGGIYCLTPHTLPLLTECIHNGMTRMREFQRALLHNDYKLIAHPFTKILDVDHASDIPKAETFLRQTNKAHNHDTHSK